MAGESRVGADERGARQITALLPNGRTVWLRTVERLAPAAALHRATDAAERARHRLESSRLLQSSAITRLSQTIAADGQRAEAARLRGARSLRRRMVKSHRRLDIRLAKARDELRSKLDQQLKIDRENVNRLRRRDLWDKILIAASLPLFSAYGQRGKLLGSHNLTLSLSLLVWLVGDHLMDAVFGSRSSRSRYAVDDADAWSYLAPIGNVLAGWWLLGDRQHERFVSGVTTVKLEKVQPGTSKAYRYVTHVDLEDRIAKDHVADFRHFANVPAVATVGAMRLSSEGKAIEPRIERLSARIDNGELRLRLTFRAVPQKSAPGPAPTALGEVDIAWIIDTQEAPAPLPAQG